MKKTVGIYVATAISCLLISIHSCSTACQQGYINPDCNVQIRAPFENLNYTATESKNSDTNYTYPATIIASQNILQVQLTNVANGFFANNVTGTVSLNGDTLTIANQNPDGNSNFIAGKGVLSGNTLSLVYTISYTDSVPYIHPQTDVYVSSWVHP